MRSTYGSVTQSPPASQKKKIWPVLDNKSCSYLRCISRSPRHAELRRKVVARASKLTGVASLLLSYDNRQSSKGFNSNSLHGEAHHQMFMLKIKEQTQILNDNNILLERNRPGRKFSPKRLRHRHCLIHAI